MQGHRLLGFGRSVHVITEGAARDDVGCRRLRRAGIAVERHDSIADFAASEAPGSARLVLVLTNPSCGQEIERLTACLPDRSRVRIVAILPFLMPNSEDAMLSLGCDAVIVPQGLVQTVQDWLADRRRPPVWQRWLSAA